LPEVSVVIFVVDKQVEFARTMRFLVGCRYATDNLGIRLEIGRTYDTSFVHYDRLVKLSKKVVGQHTFNNDQIRFVKVFTLSTRAL